MQYISTGMQYLLQCCGQCCTVKNAPDVWEQSSHHCGNLFVHVNSPYTL